MVAFLRIVGQLGAKAASWAWANKGKVLDWIKTVWLLTGLSTKLMTW